MPCFALLALLRGARDLAVDKKQSQQQGGRQNGADGGDGGGAIDLIGIAGGVQTPGRDRKAQAARRAAASGTEEHGNLSDRSAETRKKAARAVATKQSRCIRRD